MSLCQVLLEAFLMEFTSLETKLEQLRVQLQNAEDLVRYDPLKCE